jgi:hypothetical protein
MKHEKGRQDEESESDDDSLYTENNHRNRKNGSYIIDCEKNYCIYCIKHQFNGKLFNDKGWCPACVENCHCNTCIRERVIKKLIDLYGDIGGDLGLVKTEKEMVEAMRVRQTHQSHEHHIYDLESGNSDYSDIDEKTY